MKYSPCENYLAVGSHDTHIYIYQIDAETHEYSIFTTSNSHTGKIDSIDWSQDSRYIRSSDGAHETHYYNVEEKKFDAHGSETVGDVLWASNSILYGPDRKGV